MAKKVGEESEDLNKRLTDFDTELMQPEGASDHVSDADLVFLKKEVARYRLAISTVRSNKDLHLSASQQINNEVMKTRLSEIELEDL